MRLFVSDVDNTLVSEKYSEFSNRLIKSINQISNMGDEFVLCSGRPTINLILLATTLRSNGCMINYVSGFNGAEIYDLNTSDFIIKNHLIEDDLDKIMPCIKEHCYLYFSDNYIHSNDVSNSWVIRESSLYQKPITTNDDYTSSPKVLLIVDPINNKQIIKDLDEKLPDYDIFDSAPHFIEIVKKGVNKSIVIDNLCDKLNIDISNTYGFGDSGNDLELIQRASHGIAVSNATDIIKQNADLVINHVDDYAVSDYLNSQVYDLMLVDTKDKLDDALSIRREVFIKEQNVDINLEIDDLDMLFVDNCLHFVMYFKGSAISTLRIINTDEYIKIGRVCVLKGYRNMGVGFNLITMVINYLKANNTFDINNKYLYLESQVSAIKFYNKLGFSEYGDEFLDAGIMHKKMKR